MPRGPPLPLDCITLTHPFTKLVLCSMVAARIIDPIETCNTMILQTCESLLIITSVRDSAMIPDHSCIGAMAVSYRTWNRGQRSRPQPRNPHGTRNEGRCVRESRPIPARATIHRPMSTDTHARPFAERLSTRKRRAARQTAYAIPSIWHEAEDNQKLKHRALIPR